MWPCGPMKFGRRGRNGHNGFFNKNLKTFFFNIPQAIWDISNIYWLKLQSMQLWLMEVIFNHKCTTLAVCKSILYKQSKKIDLFYMTRAKNFVTIKKVCTFFGFHHQHCDKSYKTQNSHRFKEICSYCRQPEQCPPVNTLVYCYVCYRSFRGAGYDCFQNHLEKSPASSSGDVVKRKISQR